MKSPLKIALNNEGCQPPKDCGIWFSTALGTSGIELVRAPPGTSAANTSPVLVVYEPSYLDVLHNIPIANRNQVSLFRSFRPNVVVAGGGDPWDEESWKSLSGGENVEVAIQEKCKRCLRVNAAEDCEPLRTLVALRHHEGRTNFGVLCNVVRVDARRPLPRKDVSIDEEISPPMTRSELIPHLLLFCLGGPLVAVLFGFSSDHFWLLVISSLIFSTTAWCCKVCYSHSKKTPAITLGEYDISIGTLVEAH